MADPNITAETINDWLTPRQAIEILTNAYNDEHLARQILLNRLRGGMVQAVSHHTVYEPENARSSRALLVLIDSEDWIAVNTSDNLWGTVDLTYRRRRYGSTQIETVRHYGVRFEPQGVRAIVSSQPPQPSIEPVAGEQQDETRKPVPVAT